MCTLLFDSLLDLTKKNRFNDHLEVLKISWKHLGRGFLLNCCITFLSQK